MTKHIILWTIKEEYTGARREEIKAGIKNGLESLNGVIPGLVSLQVITAGLPSSSADVMLESCFESPEALKAYSANPDHNRVANAFVRPYTSQRLCLDFEE